MKVITRALASLALIAPVLSAQSIHTVDALGGGDFLDIQTAVDAAVSGDVLLVKAGTYSGFIIDGKSLVVAAEAGQVVEIDESVSIGNIAVDDKIVLQGLTLNPTQSPILFSALSLTNCAGHVLLQELNAEVPAFGIAIFGVVYAQDCAAVAIVNSTIDSRDSEPAQFSGAIVGDNSHFTMHGVTGYGSNGSDGTVMSFFGQPGGSVLELRGGSALIVDANFTGGQGGDGNTFLNPGGGGRGGHAIQLLAAMEGAPSLVVYDSTLTPGQGGTGLRPAVDGLPGEMVDVVVGTLTEPAAFARTFTAAPVVRDGEMTSIVFNGQPFDLTWHIIGFDTNSATVYLPDFLGAFHPGGAPTFFQYRGLLNGNGKKTFNFTLIPTGLDYVPVYEQALMYNATEGFVASNPVFVAFFGSNIP